MARLRHPGIVRCYGLGKSHGRWYLAMELVKGASLGDWLYRLGRLSVGDAVHVALAVARALQYAHRNGLIHRDIKPDNIMITRDGRVKLADLGLATALVGGHAEESTGRGAGTPVYMAPEQARDASTADPPQRPLRHRLCPLPHADGRSALPRRVGPRGHLRQARGRLPDGAGAQPAGAGPAGSGDGPPAQAAPRRALPVGVRPDRGAGGLAAGQRHADVRPPGRGRPEHHPDGAAQGEALVRRVPRRRRDLAAAAHDRRRRCGQPWTTRPLCGRPGSGGIPTHCVPSRSTPSSSYRCRSGRPTRRGARPLAGAPF